MHNNKQYCVTFSGKQSYQIDMAIKVQLNMVLKFRACWLHTGQDQYCLVLKYGIPSKK
jgi:hypothetical protein